MRLTKSYPNTELLFEVFERFPKDITKCKINFLKDCPDVNLPITAMKMEFGNEKYSSLSSPFDFYIQRFKEVSEKVLLKMYAKFLNGLHYGNISNLDEYTLLKTPNDDSYLAYKVDPPISLLLSIDGTYATLEDFDEETGVYSTAIIVCGKFIANNDDIYLVKNLF